MFSWYIKSCATGHGLNADEVTRIFNMGSNSIRLMGYLSSKCVDCARPCIVFTRINKLTLFMLAMTCWTKSHFTSNGRLKKPKREETSSSKCQPEIHRLWIIIAEISSPQLSPSTVIDRTFQDSNQGYGGHQGQVHQ